MLVLLLGLLAAPAGASPAGCQSLPGRSGLDQYCESVPGATGNRGPGGRTGHDGSGVPSHSRRALRHAGADGQALLGLTSGTAAAKSRSGGSGGGHGRSRGNSGARGAAGSGDNPQGAGSEPSNNPLSAVRSAVESGNSVGGSFVWVLVALGVGFFALAWLRYRRRQRPE